MAAPITVTEGRRTWKLLPPCADGTARRVLVAQQGITKVTEAPVDTAKAVAHG